MAKFLFSPEFIKGLAVKPDPDKWSYLGFDCYRAKPGMGGSTPEGEAFAKVRYVPDPDYPDDWYVELEIPSFDYEDNSFVCVSVPNE